MPRAEASSFHNPFERLGHAAREIHAWTGRHWKPLALVLAGLGFSGSSYMLVKGLSGGGHSESSNPSQPGITQLQKPPEAGGLSVKITPYPTSTPQPEATATATDTATPPPTETPVPTATALPPKKENLESVDCVILSPKACALLRPSYRINSDGSKQLLGFVGNLPVGEPIFADITGEFAKTTDSNGKPIGILSNEEGRKSKSTDIRGKIEFTGRKTVDGRHINETITTPGAAPIAIVVAPPDDPKGFNFSVGFDETERSTAKTTPDMKRVNGYFPDLETRIPYFVPLSTSAPRGVIVTDKFQ